MKTAALSPRATCLPTQAPPFPQGLHTDLPESAATQYLALADGLIAYDDTGGSGTFGTWHCALAAAALRALGITKTLPTHHPTVEEGKQSGKGQQAQPHGGGKVADQGQGSVVAAEANRGGQGQAHQAFTDDQA